MKKNAFTPTASAVLAVLASGAPLKARDISANSDLPLKDVNRALYGELKQHVRRDSGYRWSATTAKGAVSRRGRAAAPPVTVEAEAPREPMRAAGVSAINIADVSEARRLRLALQRIGEETRPDLSLAHVLMLLRIAEAGEEGVESSTLAAEVGVSAASVSRTARSFGKVHYSKKHPGFELVELGFDPGDNRRRLVRLTMEGRLLVKRVLGALK